MTTQTEKRKPWELTAEDFPWEHCGGVKWRTSSRTYCDDEEATSLLSYFLYKIGGRYELRFEGAKLGTYKTRVGASRRIAKEESEQKLALAMEGGRS